MNGKRRKASATIALLYLSRCEEMDLIATSIHMKMERSAIGTSVNRLVYTSGEKIRKMEFMRISTRIIPMDLLAIV